ncbi:methionine biosynthesis protein MetW [Lysobacter sp. BMK333-48F3]|uniref:methionine biosynthesis protein MetW n=1 Tax=Lysobacter sp. BMK333-48F3 TaxID=2867962 RepID=UPI001C8C228E|nr:methionine biosynthesis protein MetW [Lysobacter sp. BMK333-48F3]MBX9402103.1 methionine biosynthesis protein MetW [Lysobacter sp. BMK333-48F3]
MSQQTLTPVRKPRAWTQRLRALLVAALLSFSVGAIADPVIANQILQAVRYDRQILDMDLQIARSFVQNGNIAQARLYYTRAQMDATMLSVQLAKLQQQNLDSLNRGLYSNRAAMELAVSKGQMSRLQSQYIEMDLAILSQLPTSMEHRVKLDMDLFVFNMTMMQLEQAMRDAA